MRLEYFEMIDKVESIDLSAGKICCSRLCAKRQHGVRGTFPRTSAGAWRVAD